MAEIKRKGYVKHFAYLVLQQNGDKQAEDWLIDSGQATLDFIEWAKKYKLTN